MSHEKLKRVHAVYGIALSMLILITAVCFAVSCVMIYRSGPSPFTRARIAEHFARIAVPVCLTAAGVVGGMVLSLTAPMEKGRAKPVREAETVLAGLSERLDLAACAPETQTAIRKEQRLRRLLRWCAAAVSAVAFVPALLWCLNREHFTVENLNGDIIAAASFILPAAVVALGACVAVMLLCGVSVKRETALVKSALADAKQGKPTENAHKRKTKKKPAIDRRILWAVRGVILVIGVAFVVLGVLNGGMADVLGKAIRICTECIGLG